MLKMLCELLLGLKVGLTTLLQLILLLLLVKLLFNEEFKHDEALFFLVLIARLHALLT